MKVNVKVANRVITEIVEKEVEKTKCGVTIDEVLGDIDENGALQPNVAGEFIAPHLKTVGYWDPVRKRDLGLKYAFYEHEITRVDLSGLETASVMHYAFAENKITDVDLSSLKTVDGYGLSHTFERNKITELNLSSLVTVANRGLEWAFAYNELKTVDVSSLEVVGETGLSNTFYYGKFETIVFNSLREIKTQGFYSALASNSNLKSAWFPSLTTVGSSAFGPSYGYCFSGCSNLEEIHFRADAQAAIEACSGYSAKWGAPSTCTIYFDL